MCGIAGIVSHQNVNQELYDALTVLQHRGQDAAGIVTCEDGRLFLRKDNGLGGDVFDDEQMMKLKGNMGIAHVRYPTRVVPVRLKPSHSMSIRLMAWTLAHNGNLTNTAELKQALFVEDQRHINTDFRLRGIAQCVRP